MSTKNLWGNFEDLKIIKTPLAILREQGELLTASTDGVLEGRISSNKHYSGGFSISLFIVAPMLNEYSCEVLSLVHPLEFYPLEVVSNFIDSSIECKTEDDFLRGLGTILSSGKVRDIIQSLISQSKS